ncbi:putative ATP-dependent RNA helicase DDX46 [Porphyridium purpureum]|uniref:RNA helicase n=1 Tax=Porphyridium purpureum TaxID=35688 RepID=A0A5J4Z0Z5_PORPP|nr:putative ATP-dependent RNA helicase DDX46 [Porphyridium purpureum]|eukprot:POR5716..scf208_2
MSSAPGTRGSAGARTQGHPAGEYESSSSTGNTSSSRKRNRRTSKCARDGGHKGEKAHSSESSVHAADAECYKSKSSKRSRHRRKLRTPDHKHTLQRKREKDWHSHSERKLSRSKRVRSSPESESSSEKARKYQNHSGGPQSSAEKTAFGARSQSQGDDEMQGNRLAGLEVQHQAGYSEARLNVSIGKRRSMGLFSRAARAPAPGAAFDEDESDHEQPARIHELPLMAGASWRGSAFTLGTETSKELEPPAVHLSGLQGVGAGGGIPVNDELDQFMQHVHCKIESSNLYTSGERDAFRAEEGRSVEDPSGIRENHVANMPGSDVESIGISDESVPVEDEQGHFRYDPKHRKKRLLYAKVDHSTIEYAPFRKDFYIVPKELKDLSVHEVNALKTSMGGIRIRGRNCPYPIQQWAQCGLPSSVLDALKHRKFEVPTPIQAQAIPAIMKGRDVIGVACTGSGKTLAFLLPMLRHILSQKRVSSGEGPIGLVIAPTRELAVQICADAKMIIKCVGLRVAVAYGGSGIAQQIAELRRGVEIVVATPGRLIDLLAMNGGRITNLQRVTFVVLDEADRMFDLGFEPQLTRIVENVRPDCQIVMFSATFPQQVENLARRILHAPIEITAGSNSVAAASVTQMIEVRDADSKFRRLLELLGRFYDRGSALVFVDRQESADHIFNELVQAGYLAQALHGGMLQDDRDCAIADFKSGKFKVLVATSVAARGLDVKQLFLVVNYDVPSHYEDYVHRVGRTGRAGNVGVAVTFMTPQQGAHAPDMVKALRLSAKALFEGTYSDHKERSKELEAFMDASVPADLRALADAYEAKVKSGDVKFRRASGYGGKGFKFNEEEEATKREERRRQISHFGLADEENVGDEEALLAPQEAEGAQKAGTALDDEKIVLRRVRKLKTTYVSQETHITDHESTEFVSSEDISAQMKRVVAEVTHASKKDGLDEAQTKLRIAQAKAAVLNASTGAGRKSAVASINTGSHNLGADAEGGNYEETFETELEINDYPQFARWRVTQKGGMADIEEFTGAVATIKGHYYPPGRNPPAGERKLYVLVEGPAERSVREARKEVKRKIEELAALKPDDTRSGKYSVI